MPKKTGAPAGGAPEQGQAVLLFRSWKYLHSLGGVKAPPLAFLEMAKRKGYSRAWQCPKHTLESWGSKQRLKSRQSSHRISAIFKKSSYLPKLAKDQDIYSSSTPGAGAPGLYRKNIYKLIVCQMGRWPG